MATIDSLTEQYVKSYKALSVAMTEDGSIMDATMQKLNKEFDTFGIDNEQRAELLAQAYQQSMIAYNKDAMTGVSGIYDTGLKETQTGLVARQIQGYDDNMLVKVMEQQGGVTSFAVNSDSESAQSSINDLKDIIFRVQDRARKLGSTEPDGIKYKDGVLVPSNVRQLSATSTSISVEWDAVSYAGSYEVYGDGVLITTTSNLSANYSGLIADTKYSFNVKAVHTDGTTTSDLSNTLVLRTTV